MTKAREKGHWLHTIDMTQIYYNYNPSGLTFTSWGSQGLDNLYNPSSISKLVDVKAFKVSSKAARRLCDVNKRFLFNILVLSVILSCWAWVTSPVVDIDGAFVSSEEVGVDKEGVL